MVKMGPGTGTVAGLIILFTVINSRSSARWLRFHLQQPLTFEQARPVLRTQPAPSVATPHTQEKLAVRLPNWLGDTLMAYPLLNGLNQAGVDFTCFGHPWAGDIFGATGFSIVADERIRDKRWLAHQYRQGGFSRALLCPSSWSAWIPAALAGLPSTGHHPLSSPRIRKDPDAHRVEHYFELGRVAMGGAAKPNRTSGFIPLDSRSMDQVDALLSGLVEAPFVVVCPYATNLHKGMDKEWPHWREFINGYTDKPLLGLVAPEDKARFAKDYPTTAVISTRLSETAAIMCRADHVITNDSGAMHLASFFGASVVGLLGVTNHRETQPWFGTSLSGTGQPWARLDDLSAHLLKG